MSCIPTLLSCLLLTAGWSPATAQDGSPPRSGTRPGADQETQDADRALQSRARFLALRPYHARVFADLLRELRQRGVVGEWIARYEREAALGDASAVVLGARLLAAAGRLDEALFRLAELEGEHPQRDALVGRLQLGAGQPALALGSLARAAKGLERGEERRAVLELVAEAHLVLGNRAGAERALRSLAEDDAGDLGLLLDVAGRATRAGLVDLALEQLSAAEELAADDPQARSRVLSSLGRLHELRLEPEVALETYGRALALLGPDHWLEDQLFVRSLSLHRRLGTLPRWKIRLERQATAAPQRLEFVLRLARVLVATAHADEAIELLAVTAERFPSDEGLAQQRLKLLRAHGSGEQRVALLQERLARVPQDLESRLALAREFESLERRAAAEVQWRRALELRPRDAGLLRRVARLRSELGAGEVVLEHLERALELEPTDIGIHLELATAQQRSGQPDRARAVLASAGPVFDTAPLALEDLAAAWMEFGERADLVQAEQLLRRALALRDPGGRQHSALETRLARLLVDPVLTDDARTAEGRALLRARIRQAADLNDVRVELDVLLGTYSRFERASLFASESALAISGEGGLDRWRLAIVIAMQSRDPTRELALLDAYLAHEPNDRGAREYRVELLESTGELEAAAAELADLAGRFPRAARTWRLRRAELLAAAGREQAARAAVEEVLAVDFGHAPALEEASQVLQRLGHTARAVEVLGWALNLDRADAPRHLKMAYLCQADGQIERAAEHLRAAHRHGTQETREEAVKSLHALLSGLRSVGREMARLGAEAEANPFDLEATFLLTELQVLERQYRQALEVLGQSLRTRPFEVSLLERRAALLRRLGLHRAAAEDLESLAALSETPIPEIAYQLLEAHLAAGDPVRALHIARTCDDPVRAAELLAEYGRAPEAVTLLEEIRHASSVDPLVERTLGDRLAELGRFDQAISAYERFLAQSPLNLDVLRRVGDLHHAAGHEARVLEVGLELLQLTGGLRSTRAWFEEKRLFDEWVEARCEQVAAQPRSTAVLGLVAELDSLEEPPLALLDLLRELEHRARRDGLAPEGRAPLFWADELRHRELSLLTSHPVLARRRMIDLRQALDRNPGDLPDGRTAADLAWLCSETPSLYAKQEARLARALELWPASILLCTDLARALSRADRNAEAAVQWERLERLLGAGDFVAQARDERERFRRERAAYLRQRVSKGLRLELFTAVEEVLLNLDAGPLRRQRPPRSLPLDLAQVRRNRAVCLARAGERDAARSLLAAPLAAPLGALAEDLEAHFLDAAACILSSEFALSETHVRALDRALRGLEESESSTRILQMTMVDAHLWSGLGEVYKSVDGAALAYDLLRGLERPERARQMASTRLTYKQCVDHFMQRLAAAEARIDDQQPTSAAWWSAARGLHDAGVKLVELHEWTENVSGADAVLTRMAAHLPDDPSVLALAALFAERTGDLDRALDLHRRALVALEDPAGPAPGRLDWIRARVPISEPVARRATSWLALAQGAESGTQPASLAHRIAVLRLELESQEVGLALATLERLVDEVGPHTGAFVRSLQHVLSGYDLGTQASGFFAELARLAPGNLQVLRGYLGTLWDAERLEQAGSALEVFACANPELASQQAADLDRLRNHTLELIQARTDR